MKVVIQRPVTNLLAHRTPNNVCGTEVDARPNARVDRVTIEVTGELIVAGGAAVQEAHPQQR